MSTQKQTAIEAVKKELSAANDNFARSHHVFRHHSEAEMQMEYGSSGRTCAEIYADYANHRRKLSDCLTWLISLPE